MLKLLANVGLFSDFSTKQLEAASLVARKKTLQRREELSLKGDHSEEVCHCQRQTQGAHDLGRG